MVREITHDSISEIIIWLPSADGLGVAAVLEMATLSPDSGPQLVLPTLNSAMKAHTHREEYDMQRILKTLALGVGAIAIMAGGAYAQSGSVAKAVGERLGLTRQFAGTLPADKAEIIRDLQSQGRCVAMVGDGINDSPALSYADVGIAMRYGAEVTHESANVLLMEDSLWKLVKAIEISRGAVGLIKQNYAIVAVLNTLALGLALPGGLITPEMTALISNGSAILASLNGLRPVLRYQ